MIDPTSMTTEEAKEFLRKVMGPPRRTLEGKEKNDIILLLALMEPYSASNNQHSWTECYMIGKTDYHVTTFPDKEVIVEEMLKEEQ
jgi:hypothetical protein